MRVISSITHCPPKRPRPDITQLSSVTREHIRAISAANSVIRGGVTGRAFAEKIFGADLAITDYVDELKRQAKEINDGNLGDVEAMLVTQANTLDMIFNQLARRAADSQHLVQLETQLRLALKAQSQCRATLETLAEINNPCSVAFVRQANFADGPQQVNNGTQAAPSPRAPEKTETGANKLIGEGHAQTVDLRAASSTCPADSAMEAMGTVDRAENR